MNVVNYLKLDQTMPDPYGQAIWPPRIEAATPFRSQAEATAGKSRISNAWPEKLVGLNDKDAALAAGYSLSVAENTKQRIWKPRVRAEWERLRCEVATRIKSVPLSTDNRTPDGRSSLPQQPITNGTGSGERSNWNSTKQ